MSASSTPSSPVPSEDSSADDPRYSYPGRDLGRPERGPGSLARMGRRIAAFLVDWYLIYGLYGMLTGWPMGWEQILVLVAFLLYQVLLVGSLGHSLGHWLLGMQVQTLEGTPAGFGRAAIRSGLLILVIPVLITDEHGRGYHDRAAGTVLVRFR